MLVIRPRPWSGLPGAVALLALLLIVQAILVRAAGNAGPGPVSPPDVVAGVAVIAAIWLRWRRRLVIDDRSVRLFEFRRSHELARQSIARIELSGRRWHLSTHDGEVLRLSDGWTPAAIGRLAWELGLPQPESVRVGKPELVIREGALARVRFILLLMAPLLGFIYWQRGLDKAFWSVGAMMIVFAAAMAWSDYTHRIIVGDKGVLVLLGLSDGHVVSRDQISKVIKRERDAYLVDHESRLHDLDRRRDKELRALADALGVPFESVGKT